MHPGEHQPSAAKCPSPKFEQVQGGFGLTQVSCCGADNGGRGSGSKVAELPEAVVPKPLELGMAPELVEADMSKFSQHSMPTARAAIAPRLIAAGQPCWPIALASLARTSLCHCG